MLRQLAVALALTIPTLSFAETIHCRVVGVHDGDTLTCLTAARQQIKVRLAEIEQARSSAIPTQLLSQHRSLNC